MDALRSHSEDKRANQRLEVVRDSGLAWLDRQGAAAGFTLAPNAVRVDGYEQHRISRRGTASPMAFSTLDFEGLLSVSDPDTFLRGIALGFGASKAYGCGLMLIRRA